MIITISGQFGSGVTEIGESLADILGYKVYDTQLVMRAREIYKTSIDDTDRPMLWPSGFITPFNDEDEYPQSGTAYDQAEAEINTDFISTDMSFEHMGETAGEVRKNMMEAQTKAVLEFAEGGNCIFFGKGTDFILRGYPNSVHAFSRADLDIRIKRIMNRYNMTTEKMKSSWLLPSYSVQDAAQFINMGRKQATELVHSADYKRVAYYEFLTGEKWGDPEKYDYLIFGNDLNIEKETNKFLGFIREKESN